MDIVFLIGRILWNMVFLGSAMGHFAQADQMAGYAESKGVKPGKPIVLLTGVLLAVTSLSTVLGVYADLGFLLQAIYLIPVALIMHNFWAVPEDQKMMEQMQFMKDMSLAGGALAMFALLAQSEGITLMLTDPLF